MCEGGVVRSVAMACVLKANHNQDAIACSWKWNPPETRRLLYAWADYIVLMESYFIKHVPKKFHHKTRVVDVGPDRYGSSMNLELCSFLLDVTNGWSARDWEI